MTLVPHSTFTEHTGFCSGYCVAIERLLSGCWMVVGWLLQPSQLSFCLLWGVRCPSIYMWVAVFVLLALRLSAFVLLVLRSACPLCLLSGYNNLRNLTEVFVKPSPHTPRSQCWPGLSQRGCQKKIRTPSTLRPGGMGGNITTKDAQAKPQLSFAGWW